ncbi:MAG: hypothetical protein AB1547_12330 [Thermodesulfobacteriota bacterium]
MEYRIAELQHDVFQTNIDEASPPDPTISGGFKHVFAASSKGFPSHPAYARHLRKARVKRLFVGPSSLMGSQKAENRPFRHPCWGIRIPSTFRFGRPEMR